MKRILIIFLLLSASCQSLKRSKPEEGPTFDPETWGTRALISVLHDHERSLKESKLAAETLADRQMGEEDGRYLMSAAMDHPSEEVKLEILTTIGTRKLRYLYPVLIGRRTRNCLKY